MSLIDCRHRAVHALVSDPTGESNGRPDCTVFFVHGAMASMEQWRFQIAAVKPKFRIVAYDYFGCGNSPRLHDSWASYSTEEHLADLIAIFDTFKTKYNFLVGHSFGTNQVLRLAKERGDQIQGCVLVAPAIVARDGAHPIFYLPEFVLNWIQPYLSKAFMDMALHPNTRAAQTEAHKELLKVAMERSSKNSMHIAKSFYRQIKFVKQDEVVAIKGSVPCLIICGDDDRITPKHMAEQLMEWLSQRQLDGGELGYTKLETVGPASHQVMEEQPEAVNRLILDFLDLCLQKLNGEAANGPTALAAL